MSVSALERIDDICAQFESAWRNVDGTGEVPSLEAAMSGVATRDEQSALLNELVMLEHDYRTRRGENPVAGDYLARFPDFAPVIESAIGALANTDGPVPTTGFSPPSMEQMATLFPALEILGFIGKGGMGAVYKARQKGLDRLVAIKILPDEVGRDAKFALRFTREARALAKLNHPHIVSVYEFGEASGTYYFLMEYVDGSTLRDVISAGELAPQQSLAIVQHLCEALQFAHDNGVVHRDIKPENILLNKDGQVKIADFGLSRLMHNDAPGRTEEQLTETHQVMGTYRYMAPEQMEGARNVDHRADIYSLGVVFYELLTGELPLGRFAAPSEKVPIDTRLDEVVFRTLEKEPVRRYQHASEISSDIESIVESPKSNLSKVATADHSTDSRTEKLQHQELASRVLVLRRELMQKVDNALRPLYFWQVIQILTGIGFIGLGVFSWAVTGYVTVRIVSGIILHVYGVLMIAAAGFVMTRIKRFNSARPISELRESLDCIRRNYIRNGSMLGLAWWLLWIPTCVACGLHAVAMSYVLAGSIAIGVVGIAASYLIYGWIVRSSESASQNAISNLGGESLKNAYAALDEVAETECVD